MNDNDPKLTSLDEQLVAYLDGELDPESARRIEALLASDPEVRRHLQSLERTWELLDELDAAPVGEPFTQTTLEMVAVAAHDDLDRSRAEAPRRRRRWLLIVLGGLLAAAAAGFCAVALVAPDPNRQLLQDLPVLENFDEYRQVESIEFLRKLRDEKLFVGKAGGPAGRVAAAGDEDVAARKRGVEDMSAEQKWKLLRTEDRFRALTAEEQQRLWRLHRDLQSAPAAEAEQLRATMHNYCESSKSLPWLVWAELADMAPEKRIAWLKAWQPREGFRRFDAKDAEKLLQWSDAFVVKNAARFLQTLSNEAEKKSFAENVRWVRRRMIFEAVARDAASGKLSPMMTDEDLKQLRDSLSANARKSLEKLPPATQWEQLARWIQRWGMRRPGEIRGAGGPTSLDDDEKRLIEFFERLKPEQLDELLAMPGEEMLGELQRRYIRSLEGPGGPGGHHPQGPWHGRGTERRGRIGP
jgi:hypothetical protein